MEHLRLFSIIGFSYLLHINVIMTDTADKGHHNLQQEAASGALPLSRIREDETSRTKNTKGESSKFATENPNVKYPIYYILREPQPIREIQQNQLPFISKIQHNTSPYFSPIKSVPNEFYRKRIHSLLLEKEMMTRGNNRNPNYENGINTYQDFNAIPVYNLPLILTPIGQIIALRDASNLIVSNSVNIIPYQVIPIGDSEDKNDMQDYHKVLENLKANFSYNNENGSQDIHIEVVKDKSDPPGLHNSKNESNKQPHIQSEVLTLPVKQKLLIDSSNEEIQTVTLLPDKTKHDDFNNYNPVPHYEYKDLNDSISRFEDTDHSKDVTHNKEFVDHNKTVQKPNTESKRKPKSELEIKEMIYLTKYPKRPGANTSCIYLSKIFMEFAKKEDVSIETAFEAAAPVVTEENIDSSEVTTNSLQTQVYREDEMYSTESGNTVENLTSSKFAKPPNISYNNIKSGIEIVISKLTKKPKVNKTKSLSGMELFNLLAINNIITSDYFNTSNITKLELSEGEGNDFSAETSDSTDLFPTTIGIQTTTINEEEKTETSIEKKEQTELNTSTMKAISESQATFESSKVQTTTSSQNTESSHSSRLLEHIAHLKSHLKNPEMFDELKELLNVQPYEDMKNEQNITDLSTLEDMTLQTTGLTIDTTQTETTFQNLKSTTENKSTYQISETTETTTKYNEVFNSSGSETLTNTTQNELYLGSSEILSNVTEESNTTDGEALSSLFYNVTEKTNDVPNTQKLNYSSEMTDISNNIIDSKSSGILEDITQLKSLLKNPEITEDIKKTLNVKTIEEMKDIIDSTDTKKPNNDANIGSLLFKKLGDKEFKKLKYIIEKTMNQSYLQTTEETYPLEISMRKRTDRNFQITTAPDHIKDNNKIINRNNNKKLNKSYKLLKLNIPDGNTEIKTNSFIESSTQPRQDESQTDFQTTEKLESGTQNEEGTTEILMRFETTINQTLNTLNQESLDALKSLTTEPSQEEIKAHLKSHFEDPGTVDELTRMLELQNKTIDLKEVDNLVEKELLRKENMDDADGTNNITISERKDSQSTTVQAQHEKVKTTEYIPEDDETVMNSTLEGINLTTDMSNSTILTTNFDITSTTGTPAKLPNEVSYETKDKGNGITENLISTNTTAPTNFEQPEILLNENETLLLNKSTSEELQHYKMLKKLTEGRKPQTVLNIHKEMEKLLKQKKEILSSYSDDENSDKNTIGGGIVQFETYVRKKRDVNNASDTHHNNDTVSSLKTKLPHVSTDSNLIRKRSLNYELPNWNYVFKRRPNFLEQDRRYNIRTTDNIKKRFTENKKYEDTSTNDNERKYYQSYPQPREVQNYQSDLHYLRGVYPQYINDDSVEDYPIAYPSYEEYPISSYDVYPDLNEEDSLTLNGDPLLYLNDYEDDKYIARSYDRRKGIQKPLPFLNTPIKNANPDFINTFSPESKKNDKDLFEERDGGFIVLLLDTLSKLITEELFKDMEIYLERPENQNYNLDKYGPNSPNVYYQNMDKFPTKMITKMGRKKDK